MRLFRSHKAPLRFSLCSLVTKMHLPASFLLGPAGSSHENLSSPLAPWGGQRLFPVPETSTKASWGFLRVVSVRTTGSHRQPAEEQRKAGHLQETQQQKQSQVFGWVKIELASATLTFFLSSSMASLLISMSKCSPALYKLVQWGGEQIMRQPGLHCDKHPQTQGYREAAGAQRGRLS